MQSKCRLQIFAILSRGKGLSQPMQSEDTGTIASLLSDQLKRQNINWGRNMFYEIIKRVPSTM